MRTPSNDEELSFPPRTSLFLRLVFLMQAALLLVLFAWAGGAQGTVTAAAPAAAPAAPLTPAALPRAVSSFGAAELDGWVYVLGGHAGRTHGYSAESQWDGFVRLRADDPNVREELPGGVRLQSVALVAAGGGLVRIGGMSAGERDGRPHLASVAEVSRFDPATRSWSALPDLPEPRSSHDAAVLGTRVFVFGGWSLDGHSDEARWLEHGLVLDLADPTAGWRSIPQPFVQRGLALAASTRELFALGGMDEQGEFSSAVDVLDAATDTWRAAPDFPEPGFGLAAAVAGERLFVSGRSGTLWELVRGPERWEPRGDLFVPRLFHRLLASGDALVALGGSSDSLPVAWIETLRPGHSAAAARFELPFPGRARQRQALHVQGGALYLFGGNVALEQHAFEPEDFLSEAWRLDLGAGTAQALAPLPQARQSMVCVGAPDGKSVYALGGFGHDGVRDRAWDEVWSCELASGQWRALDVRLPRPMTQFRALLHGDELLLVGGMDFDREREQKMQLLDTVYAAEAAALAGGFRDTGLRLPAPRRVFGAVIHGGKLYLAGGLDESFEACPGFDAYDFASRTWSSLAAPRAGRLSPELVEVGDKLYLVAGLVFDAEGRALPAESIEEFDPARGTWRELAQPLPLDPHEVQAFAWHGKLALASTWNERGVLEFALVDPSAAASMH